MIEKEFIVYVWHRELLYQGKYFKNQNINRLNYSQRTT